MSPTHRPPSTLTERYPSRSASHSSARARLLRRVPRRRGRSGGRSAERGVCVVSGLALGVDAAAHEGAVEAAGTTVGVLGCGIDIVYPRSNRGLFDSVRRHGALVSEYYLGEAPLAWRFPAQEQDHRRAGIHGGRRRGTRTQRRPHNRPPRSRRGKGRVGGARSARRPRVPGLQRAARRRRWRALGYPRVRRGRRAAGRGGDRGPRPRAVPAGLPETEAAVLSGVGFEPRGVDAVARRSGVEMPERAARAGLARAQGLRAPRQRGRLREEGRSVTEANVGRALVALLAGSEPDRRGWDVLRAAQVGGARGEGAQGQAGRQLLAAGQVRRWKDRGARRGAFGSGGPHLVRAGRTSWRRRDLRSGAQDQVRVVRDLQDPVVHPRRAEEGGSPLAPHAPEGAPDRPRQGRAGAEAGPCADGVRARRVSGHQRHRAPGVPRPVRAGAGEVASKLWGPAGRAGRRVARPGR